jgi:Co/Zn/Cd efflux system component
LDSHEHVGHGHSHGLVDDAVKRSRAGIRAVALSLAVLGIAAAAQTIVFATTSSIALLADLIHNGGDALTAAPLGIAFMLRSRRARHTPAWPSWARLAITLVILRITWASWRTVRGDEHRH